MEAILACCSATEGEAQGANAVVDCANAARQMSTKLADRRPVVLILHLPPTGAVALETTRVLSMARYLRAYSTVRCSCPEVLLLAPYNQPPV